MRDMRAPKTFAFMLGGLGIAESNSVAVWQRNNATQGIYMTTCSTRFTLISPLATATTQKETSPVQTNPYAGITNSAALDISSYPNGSCFDQWTSFNQKYLTAYYCGEWNGEWCVSTKSGYAQATITPPPCTLPSIVPQCQTLWSSWVAQEFHPNNFTRAAYPVACSSASIGGSQCDSLVSSYISAASEFDGFSFGQVGNQQTTISANGSQLATYYWPSTSPLAPGCTLGCANCRVTGGTVQLIYWEPQTTYRNYTLIALSPNVTGEPKTAIVDGVTLTSPTVYVSFDSLYAQNSCGKLGKTYTNTIVAITNSATLSSLYGWGRYNDLAYPASFNFTDLYVSPVPYSISTSLNWCTRSIVSAQAQAELTGDPNNITYTCPSMPYAPTLSIPQEVLALDPDWTSCTGGLTGVYDPPTALIAATVEATASFSSHKSSTAMTESTTSSTAWPASTLVSPTPLPTAGSHDPQTAASSSNGNQGQASVSGLGPAGEQSVEPNNDGAGSTAIETAQTSEGTANSSTASSNPTAKAGSADSSSRSDKDSQTGSSSASTTTLGAGQSASVDGVAVSAIDDPSSGSPAIVVGGSQILSAGGQTTIGSIIVSVNGQGLGVLAPASMKSQLSFSYDPVASSIASVISFGPTASTASRSHDPQGASSASDDPLTSSSEVRVGTAVVTQVASSSNFQILADGGSAYTISANGQGAPIVGQTVSLASGSLVAETQAAPYTSTQSTHDETQAVITASGTTLTAAKDPTNSAVAVVDGSMLSAGGSAVTLSNEATLSLESAGIINGELTVAFSTVSLPAVVTDVPGSGGSAEAVITDSYTTITATRGPHMSNVAILNGETLTQGGEGLTLSDGDVVSLGYNGVVMGSSTFAFSTPSSLKSDSGSSPSGQTHLLLSGSVEPTTTTKSSNGVSQSVASSAILLVLALALVVLG